MHHICLFQMAKTNSTVYKITQSMWCYLGCETTQVASLSDLYFLSKFNALLGWWWTEWGQLSRNHLCSAASYRSAAPMNDSVSNSERRLRFADSSWGLHVAQVLAWEAVVGAGFRQPVVSRAGTTRRYQAGAPTPWQLFHN